MTYFIIGLGNPGEEYADSRHNTGRMAVSYFAEASQDKKFKIIESTEFMNHSGRAVAKAMAGKTKFENLIVVYDDIDLSLRTIKISYNKSSGGHRGLESIIKALKTQEFIRIRIGISSATPSGKIKKPKGEDAVLKFILGKFKPTEIVVLKKTFKKASEAIEMILEEGKDKAMNTFN